MIRVRFYITDASGERKFGSDRFYDDLTDMTTDQAVHLVSRRPRFRIEIQHVR